MDAFQDPRFRSTLIALQRAGVESLAYEWERSEHKARVWAPLDEGGLVVYVDWGVNLDPGEPGCDRHCWLTPDENGDLEVNGVRYRVVEPLTQKRPASIFISMLRLQASLTSWQSTLENLLKLEGEPPPDEALVLIRGAAFSQHANLGVVLEERVHVAPFHVSGDFERFQHSREVQRGAVVSLRQVQRVLRLYDSLNTWMVSAHFDLLPDDALTFVGVPRLPDGEFLALYCRVPVVLPSSRGRCVRCGYTAKTVAVEDNRVVEVCQLGECIDRSDWMGVSGGP